MREAVNEGLPAGDAFVHSMDTCVQCRGCETACPSEVPFGSMMEEVRAGLVETPGYLPWWRRIPYYVLRWQWLVILVSRLLAVAQRAHLVPRRLGLPDLPLRSGSLESSGDDVVLFTGCVMDAWQRSVHEATKQVIESTGAGVKVIANAGCCGALAAHAGMRGEAHRSARHLIGSLTGDKPILVNSAGCGAQLKDVGAILATVEARRFSARVMDVHEWLAERLDQLPPGRLDITVAVQDPCHLRHVQHVETAVAEVLGVYAEVVHLDDEGLCCGAGGAYAALQPDLAGKVRSRKIGAIERSGAAVVASANPGCSLHLRAAGVDARHPMELVAEAIR
jgi:glycolate oxidase iron-sulfur subunit